MPSRDTRCLLVSTTHSCPVVSSRQYLVPYSCLVPRKDTWCPLVSTTHSCLMVTCRYTQCPVGVPSACWCPLPTHAQWCPAEGTQCLLMPTRNAWCPVRVHSWYPVVFTTHSCPVVPSRDACRCLVVPAAFHLVLVPCGAQA